MLSTPCVLSGHKTFSRYFERDAVPVCTGVLILEKSCFACIMMNLKSEMESCVSLNMPVDVLVLDQSKREPSRFPACIL